GRPQTPGPGPCHQRAGGRKPDAPEGRRRRHKAAFRRWLPVTDKPRRSAGMRGSPLDRAPEHRPISTTPVKQPAEPAQPQRVSTSPYAKPKVLMGEVAAPKGQLI